MFYVYLLKSKKDDNYYIGQTNDIKKRADMHSKGKVSSTKYRRPLKLLGYEMHKTREGARWREYQLKHHSDKKKEFIEQCLKLSKNTGE